VAEAGRPQVFHRDWELVTKENPAKPGEDVIARAVDLGATRPGVPAGKAFPQDPLVDVIAKIEVHVDGRPADAPNRIGWPGEIDTYRVDIHIPEQTAAGMAKLTFTVNGVTGKAAEIPVQ